MKWKSFLGLLALTALVGCSKPLAEPKAIAQCLLLATKQGRELNCHHCDRCFYDPYLKEVILEETQAGKVIKTWPIE